MRVDSVVHPRLGDDVVADQAPVVRPFEIVRPMEQALYRPGKRSGTDGAQNPVTVRITLEIDGNGVAVDAAGSGNALKFGAISAS